MRRSADRHQLARDEIADLERVERRRIARSQGLLVVDLKHHRLSRELRARCLAARHHHRGRASDIPDRDGRVSYFTDATMTVVPLTSPRTSAVFPARSSSFILVAASAFSV